MHELFRALPANAPELVRKLETSLIGLSCSGAKTRLRESGLRLINLSRFPSGQIMGLCLSAVLDRPEWVCFRGGSREPAILRPVLSFAQLPDTEYP